MRHSRLASFAVAFLVAPAASFAALDTFDSYANGSSLNGQSNGQMSWALVLQSGDSVQATNVDSTSAPNSLAILDPSINTTEIEGRPVGGGIDNPVGTSIVVSFNYKSVGSRSGMAFRPHWSSDAIGTSESNIANSQQTGTGSGGHFFANNGNILAGNLFSADQWYNIEITYARTGATTRDISIEMTDLSNNSSLGVVTQTGADVAGRPFLTMFELRTTSENRSTRIDDFSITFVPEPASASLLIAAGTGLAIRRRRSFVA